MAAIASLILPAAAAPAERAWPEFRGPEGGGPADAEPLPDAGVACAIEAKTAVVVWRERLGGAYWASPIHAAGRISFAVVGRRRCSRSAARSRSSR